MFISSDFLSYFHTKDANHSFSPLPPDAGPGPGPSQPLLELQTKFCEDFTIALGARLAQCTNSVLNVKAGAFYHEKRAFSVIVKLREGSLLALAATLGVIKTDDK